MEQDLRQELADRKTDMVEAQVELQEVDLEATPVAETVVVEKRRVAVRNVTVK